MMEESLCVGGDGGPLIVIQASAVPLWQGASDFENSLMNGGDVETDYDVICDLPGELGVGMVTRYEREMLVLWDSEFSATRLPSEALSLAPDVIVLTMAYHPDDLPGILPIIAECVQAGAPERSLPFFVQDEMLRLQVGADCAEPSYLYQYLDIPIAPGRKQCEIYSVKHNSLEDEVVVIRDDVAA
ncbi:MAG: Imm21 family immunity protein [Capsulimonas sp.]|uniref:Imm21 family immunity protein n=1 Tax=Capsulimonas sp. TaxID=2494211 RepID=UPI003264D110